MSKKITVAIDLDDLMKDVAYFCKQRDLEKELWEENQKALDKLGKLLDRGLITKEEYSKKSAAASAEWREADNNMGFASAHLYRLGLHIDEDTCEVFYPQSIIDQLMKGDDED